MPTLARSRSASPPSSPPRMSPDRSQLKMKSPEELLANPMDLLKNANPFLMPAQLLALNPQLYAAQLAQLQAAQLMLAKQTLEQQQEVAGEAAASRKRGGDTDLEAETRTKQPRSSPPRPGAPLDLSGSRSPELKAGEAAAGSPMFNPMMQAGLLNFFNQLRPPASVLAPATGSPPSPGRHTSPWAAQWASRTSDTGAAPEDVFKCAWDGTRHGSLDQLSKHMREAKHGAAPPSSSSLAGPGFPGLRPPVSSPVRPSLPLSSPTLASPPGPGRAERDVLREQMPIPRKLVRGQDVWIGRADEQTRDILKCMGCGESFRTLDLLTKHMQATQHYKKVISHDQISTWKYSDPPTTATKSPVSSVLSCKVCDKGFSSLKDLSDHMVRNNHYAGAGAGPGEPKLPRSPVAPPPALAAPSSASRDRKKSLPVKKLLELERARQEVAGNKSEAASREVMESGKLMCERCEEKIPLDIFIPHIQQCVGRPRFLKAAAPEPAAAPSANNKDSRGGSKAEAKEAGGGDGSSSILGSLEQLVKGNFTSSASASAASKVAPPISSPVPSFPAPQSSPLAKFSITSLFPVARSVSPPSSSPGSSKPASPNNNSNHLQQPSLEKMLDSPIEPRPAPSPAPASTAAAVNGAADRQSPGSEASGASPHSQLTEKREAEAAEPEDGSSEAGDTKPAGHNALAALQSFCNDQTKPAKQAGAREAAGAAPATSAAAGSPMSDPGAILAFSWAVNQATASTGSPGGDTAIKCPFCETPFISKGAYRHHLSKMHFTKENLGNISTANIPQVTGQAKAQAPAANRTPSPEAKDAEESLQSKYQKYSQLAKQLSCYDGTN